MKRGIVIFCSIVGVVIVAVAVWVWYMRPTDSGTPVVETMRPDPSLVREDTLAALSRNTSSQVINRSHISEGVSPPTNKWFSGFTLQKDPRPGFAYPNSYRPTTNGLEVSLPKVIATAETITGGHAADVVVTVEGAVSYRVIRYDELTVDVAWYDKTGTALVTATMAVGIPYVFLRALAPAMVATNLSDGDPYDKMTKIKSVNGVVYGVRSATESSDTAYSLKQNDELSVFSAPNRQAISNVARYAANTIKSGLVTYTVNNQAVKTILHYATLNNQPTMIAALPHQQSKGDEGVRYQSIYGDLIARSGNDLTYEVPAVGVQPSLDLARLSKDDKAMLVSQLQKDVASTDLSKPDTYFAGKQLYRTAQLLDIAIQLGDTTLTVQLKEKLKATFTTWLRTDGTSDVRSFSYSDAMRSVVGREASFGSDVELNDHHFHYGYFIYAAAILARHDASFLSESQPMIELLVADIANYRQDEKLPLRRSYDAYAGHSWASGTMPFADGNNQESVSEAINAWTGIALWADITRNQVLSNEARWMLANEFASAKQYWLDANSTKVEYLKNYTAPIVSMNWGAKRVYQTFFSDEANAKLGIQLIPMNPSMQALTLSEQQLRGINQSGMFGDYILMARRGSLDEARRLPDSAVDDGDSRTYLYAWTLANKQ